MSLSASRPIERLLGSIASARPLGRGWIARCPAHDDREPSLAIAEGDDDRVLLHCFAGCTAQEIVSALGLSVSDLFGERDGASDAGGHRRRLPVSTQVTYWRAALAVLDRESLIVLLAARQLAAGLNLDDADQARLGAASARISDARQVLRAH